MRDLHYHPKNDNDSKSMGVTNITKELINKVKNKTYR